LVLVAHYIYLGLFPDGDPAQARWAAAPSASMSSWNRYVETQDYLLGFSYAISLSFAAAAFRRYREEQLCATRNLASAESH
jgi:hypothetical protein